jgi:hypothetical protein
VGGPTGDPGVHPALVPPSDGGAPRLVAVVGDARVLAVWCTGTGELLGALPCLEPAREFTSLVTYQRPSGGTRIAAGLDGGHLCCWDGDDLQVVHAVEAGPGGAAFLCLAVYEEPTSGRTRLVTG